MNTIKDEVIEMKKILVLTMTILMVLGFASISTGAMLDGTAKLTINDGWYNNTAWHGNYEDNEVEPPDVTGQIWDLEGFYMKNTTLTMVGGYNFKNGQDGYKVGDIFFDTTGDVRYNADLDTNTSNGYHTQTNGYGYDYAVRLNFGATANTYDVYSINQYSMVTTAYFRANDQSNPWKYASGGTLIGSGAFTYVSGLTDAAIGDGLLGGSHNAVILDIAFLGAGTPFTVHNTIQCGNDNLMGRGTTPVPEPSTFILFGAGLAGAALFRKRIKR